MVEDLKSFESDEKVIKKIVRTAVEQKLLGSDSSLIACPSPNCEGVFRRFFIAVVIIFYHIDLTGWRKVKSYKMERLFFASSADQKYAAGLCSEINFAVVVVCHIKLTVLMPSDVSQSSTTE